MAKSSASKSDPAVNIAGKQHDDCPTSHNPLLENEKQHKILEHLPIHSAGDIGISHLLTRFDLGFLILSTICAICGGALIPMIPLVFSQFASEFLNVGGDPNTSTTKGLVQNTLWLIYLAAGELTVIFIANFGFIIVGDRISRRLRENYLAALLRQDLAFFSTFGIGGCTARLTTDINIVQRGISEKISRTIHALSTFFTAFILGFVLCWKLTLILTWSIVAALIMMVTGFYMTRNYNFKNLDAAAIGNTIMEEGLSSIRNIKALGAEDRIAKRYEECLDTSAHWSTRLKILMGVLQGLSVGVNYLNIAMVLWQGSVFLANGEARFTDVVTIELAIVNALYALLGISNHVETFTRAVYAAKKVLEATNRLSKMDASSLTGTKPTNIQGSITFHNVSYHYENNSSRSVLSNFSAVFPAGKTTAIVGVSGSGKSTIFSLIERFQDPMHGEIFLDAHNISHLNLRWLRQQIGTVSQHPSLFATSILENICDGLIGTEFEFAPLRVKRQLAEVAAKACHAHDFITILSDGYDSFVGDRGFMLSGGQKQRIAIARAIVGSPKILILDEATSAMDSESENKILKALEPSAAGRSTIVIAHRLSTIKAADNIIVLDKGQLIEQGTHEQLMDRQGAYHRLVKTTENTNSASFRLDAGSGASDSVKSAVTKVKDNDLATGASAVTADSLVPQHEVSNQSIWSILSFVAKFSRPDLILILAGLFCCVIGGAEESVNAILFAESLISLSLPQSEYGEMRKQVGFWAYMFLMLAIIQLLVFASQGAIFAVSSERMARRLKSKIFRNALQQDIHFFDKSDSASGFLMSFLTAETEHLCALSGATLGLVLIIVTTLATAVIIALAFGWKLALVCIATIPLILYCAYLNTKLLTVLQKRTSKALCDAAGNAVEALSEMRTIASLTKEKQVQEKYHQSLVAISKNNLWTTAKFTLLYAWSQAVLFLCMALGFWYGGVLLASGEYTPLQFFVVFSSITFSAKSAGYFFSFTDDISKAFQAARSLKSFCSNQREDDYQIASGRKVQHSDGGFQFCNVSFQYPGQETRILKDISFQVNPGDHIALVGPSGSGKSTIISLLERFYDPTEGSILLDGVEVSTLELNSYRSCFALVSQNITLYAGTIRDNLLFGVDPAVITDGDIENACNVAFIYDFILSLPQGMSTIIGTKGCTLSGGQKQRISIARAVLRNPRILLLDEATSALDSESEYAVQKALETLSRGRTTVTVAHKLNTIRQSDRIYVIEHGKIVEEGTHDVLIANGQRYAHLEALQKM